jgi:hypothetical protein
MEQALLEIHLNVVTMLLVTLFLGSLLAVAFHLILECVCMFACRAWCQRRVIQEISEMSIDIDTFVGLNINIRGKSI